MTKSTPKSAKRKLAPRAAAEIPESIAHVSEVAGRIALFCLLGALMLAGYNLSLTVGSSGELTSLEGSWRTLQTNYTAALTDSQLEPPAQVMPPVLWSVARFRAGEQEELSLKLVGPLMARSMESGPKLAALLIERKNPNSRDVLVREFLDDGSEESYLWPSTHADADGFWLNE